MAIEIPVINETINASVNITQMTQNISVNDTINVTTQVVEKVNAAVGSPFSTMLIIAFIGIVLLMFLFAFFMKGLNLAITLALNSIIGFFALYAIQLFLLPGLVINIWSIALVAILGLAGMIAVLVLHGLGMFF